MKEEIARALIVLDSDLKPARDIQSFRVALNEQEGPFFSGIEAAIAEWFYSAAWAYPPEPSPKQA